MKEPPTQEKAGIPEHVRGLAELNFTNAVWVGIAEIPERVSHVQSCTSQCEREQPAQRHGGRSWLGRFWE